MVAKWRTKSGCLTCRKRRKKCDEGARDKGICTACVRNNLTCIWPGQGSRKHVAYKVESIQRRDRQQTNARQDFETPSPKAFDNAIVIYESTCTSTSGTSNGENLSFLMRNSPFQPSMWHGTKPDLHLRHELFNYYATALCAMMIRSDAHPGFQDWTYTISQAFEHPCLMDTLLACSAIQLARKRPDMLQMAFGYYSSAVSNTRVKIEAGEIDGSEDWLLMMVCHLAIFERNQPESSSRAGLHLQGAVYLMSLKRAKVSESTLVSIQPYQRLYAESVIYNTCFTAFLSPDINWLLDSKVWEQVDVFCTTNPYPSSPESSISPLLGVPVKICYLILEISCLARRLPWSNQDSLKAVTLRSELDAWLADCERDNHGEMRGLSWKSAKLFLFAADILLFKAMESDVPASHQRVRRRVQQSLNLLRQDDLEGMYWNQHFCWPVVIIACALELSTDFLFLQFKLESQWERSYFGDVKRTADILQAIWERYYGYGDESQRSPAVLMESEPVECEDMIDLLLCRDGLCSIVD